MNLSAPNILPQPNILVVDDDPDICALIAAFLDRQGFTTGTAGNAKAMDRALNAAAAAGSPVDLIVLDRMMPGEDGISITRRMTAANGPAVIILSAMGEDICRIEGLDGGADDYLSKPVNPDELVSRIRAVLRRRSPTGAGRMASIAGWTLNLVRRELSTPAGVLVALTDGEFALMQAFAEAPGQTIPREALVARLHGGSRETFDRAIDVQVSRLRKKLERAGGEDGVHLIRTVRNGGYQVAASGR